MEESKTHIKLTRLNVALEKCKTDVKYCIIHDKNGNAETFFAYSANLVDFGKELTKIKNGT